MANFEFYKAIDSSRQKGRTDTDILDFLSSRGGVWKNNITQLRQKAEASGKSDREVLNFLSDKLSGQLPGTPSVAIKEDVAEQGGLEDKNKFQQFAESPLKTIAGGVAEKFGATAKFGKEAFVDPIGRALTRPFAGVTRGIQGLVPGGKTGQEPVETPFGTLEIEPGKAKGQLAGEAVEVALASLPVEKLAGKLFSPLAKRANKLYQSVLKPTGTSFMKKQAVETGLEEGIKVSKKGLGKVINIIEDIGDDIQRVIDSGVASGKSIKKADLIPYLDETKEYFSKVVGGKELVKKVDDLSFKYLKGLKKEIPIDEAQDIKRATQQYIKKYYQKQAPTTIEVRKQLARGLKEEIAEQVPEIAKLNARDSKLIGLEKSLAKTVDRIGNREIIGLNDLASIGAGGLTGGTGGAVGLPIIFRLLKSPSFASSRAILYNNLAKNATKSANLGRWAVYGTIGKIISSFEDED